MIPIPHDNPYNTLRRGLHDKLPNLTPLFTSTWFSEAFCHICVPILHSNTMWNFFSTYLFKKTMLTLIVKLNKTISIKYNLKQIFTVLSSIAHGFLNILTADMVHDLKKCSFQKIS